MGKKKTISKADAIDCFKGLSEYEKVFLLTVAMIGKYGFEAVKEKYFPEIAAENKNELVLV